MALTEQLKNATKLIDRWLEYQVYANEIPGLSIGLVYKNKVIFSKGYGYADIQRKIKATDTTCYRIASFSKVFTAIAILQLFEHGKLHLDDRVQHYLPWFRSERDEQTKQITIRQLLTHTAGLDREGDTSHWTDFHFPSLDQVKQHVAAGALVSAPAEKWKYSNFGYSILGEVIKVVSGVPYEEYMREQIVQRLGLSYTAPTLTNKIIENLAVGYSRKLPGQQRESFPLIETNAMAPATGFSSNIADFCQFMIAQFDGNTSLLADETKREMRRIQWLREGLSADWCLGLQTWRIFNRRVYGHGGSFQGYQSRFGIDTGREIGLALFANAIDAPSTDLANSALQIVDYLIEHFDDFRQPSNRVENVERYEGKFRNIWGDIEFIALDQSLILYNLKSKSPVLDFYQLQPEGDHQFTVTSGDSLHYVGESVRFEFDSEGKACRVFVGPEPFTRFECQN